jgi:hypothetical protein
VYYVNADGFGHDGDSTPLNAYLRANITALYLPSWYGNAAPPSGTAALEPPPDAELNNSSAAEPRGMDDIIAERVKAETDKIRQEFQAELEAIRELLDKETK